MIIGFPTALYNSVLPKEITDSQSVTFLISSTDPPRSAQTFFQLLRSEELKTLPAKIHSNRRRRANLGEFVFNISFASQNQQVSGAKTFESGQLLDFTDVEPIDSLETLEVPEIIDVQQNNNLLDLEALGLTEEESDSLINQSEDKFHESVTALNEANMVVKNIKADIEGNQKLINETRKARNAALVVFSDSSTGAESNEIVIKLNQKEQELLEERQDFISSLNIAVEQANEIYEEMLRLREMVR